MRVELKDRYKQELGDILRFIAKDSPSNAKRFANSLKTKLTLLPNNPYKYRQSKSFDDKQIRDFIFKGYVIPYYIDEDKSCLVVLGIFGENEWFAE